MSNRETLTWKRADISSCRCDDKSYRHVHCPCFRCNGRATDRKTELRHWHDANQLHETDLNSMDVGFDLKESGNSQIDNLKENDVDTEDYVQNELPNVDVEMEDDEEDNSSDIDANRSKSDCNPLKHIVIKAVLDALKIKYESG